MLNDELDLIEDEETPPEANTPKLRVMLVDDDEMVHRVFKMAISNMTYHDIELEVLDAYSGAEAGEMIKANPDVAAMLLDVVMETDHAGLDVVDYVRKELRNKQVQIILCTGQAGLNDERDVVSGYMVNAYFYKTNLTVDRFYSALYTALNSYTLTRDLLMSHGVPDGNFSAP